MMIGTVSLTKKDTGLSLDKVMADISKLAVYVGIPEDKSIRKEKNANNAQLLFIHTNGSPLRHIPKRPVVEPAIEHDKDKISVYLGEALKAILDGKPVGEVKKLLHKAGLEGEEAARLWFDDPRNNWQENALSTILAKIRKKKGFKMAGYKRLSNRIAARQKARNAAQAYYEGAEGINEVLVDTDQMRKALTHVVRST